MLTKAQYENYRRGAVDIFQKAHIVLTKPRKNKSRLLISVWVNSSKRVRRSGLRQHGALLRQRVGHVATPDLP